jgi:hypothetical protein
LTEINVDPAVRAELAPKYAEFSTAKQQQLSSLIDGDNVAASNAGRLETEGVRNALDYACNSPCSIQTDLGSPMWKVDAEVHDSLKTRLSSDQSQRLAESDIGTEALEAIDDLDSISTIKRVDGGN